MDYQLEIEKIAKWMRAYSTQVSKTKGFVVGLSGGIDSSVIACLSVKAVGKENVIGISLPCQTRQDMKDDAKELAENLGIRFETINLWESFKYMASDVQRIFGNDDREQITDANIKARLRMTALYGVANKTNTLVAGTGNKSELMVGYFTKYGDGGVDIEPIGNYYKTQVYKMAEFMPEIPDKVKTKAPTADLWEGQTDEDELGMTYARLDVILSKMEPYYTWRKMYEDSYDNITEEEWIEVLSMIRRSEHKNEVPPRYERE